MEKHENVNYRTIDKMGKLLNDKFYKRHDPVYIDGECRYYEIVSKKKAIKDRVPIATAFYILGNAKLLVMNFVKDIENCLITDALRILYMGTINLFFDKLTLIFIRY